MPQVGGLAAFACALLLLGCGDPEERPIGPGGGPIGGGGGADGGATTIAKGRICIVQDLNDRGPCQTFTNSELTVTARGTSIPIFSDVESDGTFEIVDLPSIKNEHIPMYVRSTDEWVGGAIWADAKPGEDIVNLEIPVMLRTSLDNIKAQSGATTGNDNSVIAIQVTNFSGLPLDNVSFAPFEYDATPARYGGPSGFSTGSTTTSTGTAAFFDTLVDENGEGFDLPFTDAGEEFTTHGTVWSDSFTIIPVQLSR